MEMRSTNHIYNHTGEEIACYYRQSDSHGAVHGRQLQTEVLPEMLVDVSDINQDRQMAQYFEHLAQHESIVFSDEGVGVWEPGTEDRTFQLWLDQFHEPERVAWWCRATKVFEGTVEEFLGVDLSYLEDVASQVA